MTVASTGVKANEQSDTDFEYLDTVVAGVKQYRKLTVPQHRLPVSEIEAALQPGEYRTEPGSPEHVREVMADKVSCPLCDRYQTWNRELMRQHLVKHEEIQSFKKSVSNSRQTYDSLQQRRSKIKNQLQILRNEFLEIDRRIEQFDLAEQRSRQKQAQKLLQLLGA